MAPLRISELSVLKLRELIAREPNRLPSQGIRLYISGLSAYGPEWSLMLDNYAQEVDECCEFDDLKVIVERELLEAVGGLDVQYEAMADDDGGFLITALDPAVQALYGGGCGGGCHGGCGGCGGGCHGGCGGCGGDCSGDCGDCNGDCESCHEGHCHCHEDED